MLTKPRLMSLLLLTGFCGARRRRTDCTHGWARHLHDLRDRQLTAEPVRPDHTPQGGHMNYALLVYIAPELLRGLSSEDKLSLHGGGQPATSASASLVAHYRLRPPRTATTIRLNGDEIVKADGPSVEMREGLRALYVLESDEPDAVHDFASRLPAVRLGGTVEVWPLIEPGPHAQE